jgi:hypothetical protein
MLPGNKRIVRLFRSRQSVDFVRAQLLSGLLVCAPIRVMDASDA